MNKTSNRESSPAQDLRQTFADNLRAARQRKRLSQRDIAGVPQKTVSAAEAASVDLHLSTMVRMAMALGEDVAALLEKPATTD